MEDFDRIFREFVPSTTILKRSSRLKVYERNQYKLILEPLRHSKSVQTSVHDMMNIVHNVIFDHSDGLIKLEMSKLQHATSIKIRNG